jgi:hypothetical protein
MNLDNKEIPHVAFYVLEIEFHLETWKRCDIDSNLELRPLRTLDLRFYDWEVFSEYLNDP